MEEMSVVGSLSGVASRRLDQERMKVLDSICEGSARLRGLGEVVGFSSGGLMAWYASRTLTARGQVRTIRGLVLTDSVNRSNEG